MLVFSYLPIHLSIALLNPDSDSSYNYADPASLSTPLLNNIGPSQDNKEPNTSDVTVKTSS